jgi:hypothetical protein
MVSLMLDNQLELIRLGKFENKFLSVYFCDYLSVLPMGNGVNTPTGYIINGGPTQNMQSLSAQLG